MHLIGTETSAAELAEMQSQENPFALGTKMHVITVDYQKLLEVLRATGSDANLAGLTFIPNDQVEIEVLIYQMTPEGQEDVISAPRVTTRPGNEAQIRVVENASGRRNYQTALDPYHQEDLANLGIRLSAKPQIIDDYLRVSGTAILTKLSDRRAVFVEETTPVASYSCTKTVVPFSFVFSDGTDTVDFPVARIDGKDTMCRLTAQIVDDRGMTRKDREKVRKVSGAK
jgi:hypothetical protein